MPAITVWRREVWTKETKGQRAVRTRLVWKTNKEAADSAFPAFVAAQHLRMICEETDLRAVPDGYRRKTS